MRYDNISQKSDELKGFVWAIYILQILTFFTGGIAFVASGIIAYIKHDDSIGTMEESHFRWQIKTFWTGLIGLIAGVLLVLVWIGVIILGLTQLWILYRAIKGAYFYLEDREMDNQGFF